VSVDARRGRPIPRSQLFKRFNREATTARTVICSSPTLQCGNPGPRPEARAARRGDVGQCAEDAPARVRGRGPPLRRWGQDGRVGLPASSLSAALAAGGRPLGFSVDGRGGAAPFQSRQHQAGIGPQLCRAAARQRAPGQCAFGSSARQRVTTLEHNRPPPSIGRRGPCCVQPPSWPYWCLRKSPGAPCSFKVALACPQPDVLGCDAAPDHVLAELLGKRRWHGAHPSSADTHRRRSDVTYPCTRPERGLLYLFTPSPDHAAEP
jgi:hypothetical protein